MFKALVILFIWAIFLLVAYKIFIHIQSPKIIKSTQKIEKPKQKNILKKQTTPTTQKPTKATEKSPQTHLPKIIIQTIDKIADKITKSSPTEASLAENIEAIGGKIGNPIFIRIFKEEAQLEIWMRVNEQYQLIQTYPICAFSGDLGPKLQEGDKQSPEGFYYVTKSRLNPNSRFHLSFNLGYPNHYDRVLGRTGSFLMVHGECVSIGCYAMTNGKIEEIYELVEQALFSGQKIVRVHAFPFRMSQRNMHRYSHNKWYSFWENLKEGYDWFEEHKVPPNVGVRRKKYIFD